MQIRFVPLLKIDISGNHPSILTTPSGEGTLVEEPLFPAPPIVRLSLLSSGSATHCRIERFPPRVESGLEQFVPIKEPNGRTLDTTADRAKYYGWIHINDVLEAVDEAAARNRPNAILYLGRRHHPPYVLFLSIDTLPRNSAAWRNLFYCDDSGHLHYRLIPDKRGRSGFVSLSEVRTGTAR